MCVTVLEKKEVTLESSKNALTSKNDPTNKNDPKNGKKNERNERSQERTVWPNEKTRT